MFIASSVLDGKKYLLILGLSDKNMEKLKNKQPMLIDRESHGMAIPENLGIVIFNEESEEKMMAIMKELIGPDTVGNQKRPM